MNTNGTINLVASVKPLNHTCASCGNDFGPGQMVTPDGWRFYCLADELRS